eukprot:scaffold16903_cov199-Amphora_coffeaeformis.AAC.1
MIITKLFLPFLVFGGNLCSTKAFALLWTTHPGRLHHHHRYHHQQGTPTSTGQYSTEQSEVVTDGLSVDTQQHEDEVLTSILFQVSYDGSRFSGWSAGNDNNNNNKTTTATAVRHPPRSSRRRRNRNLYSADSHGIRSVQGVLQLALAKIYGNVDPQCIVVEGASRTDKGVHAYGMVAHVYGLVSCTTTSATATTTTITPNNNNSAGSRSTMNVIPGKRLPHPRNATDMTCFLPLPMPPAKMAFTLNRMLPPDVRIMQYATTTTTTTTIATTPTTTMPTVFHASQSATGKTYTYRLAQGPRPDPTAHRTTWYIGNVTPTNNINNTRNTTDGGSGGVWDSEALQQVTQLLTAYEYNFSAFAGAPRGADDKRKRANQDTTCRLHRIDIATLQENNDSTTEWMMTMIPGYQEITITITGNRFLYKMMRFLVGTLVAVARQDVSVQDVEAMLTTGLRSSLLRIECAPARGL